MTALIEGKLACAALLLLLLAACGPAPSAAPRLPPAVTPLPPAPAATPTLAPAAASPTATQIAAGAFDGVRVTFVFNAGFLITAGDKRILIDAIYEGYPEGTLKPILQSQPPFDGVDLILATHEHVDHFSPALVRRYMLANPNTVFASTQGAARQLLALGGDLRGRVIAIEIAKGESRQIEVSGIAVEAVCLPHGASGLLNLGFVITIGDTALFHTGDVETVGLDYLQSYGLPDKQLDIAFVPYFYFTEEAYYPLLLDGIRAGYLVPMHYGGRVVPSERFDSLFPNYFIFAEPYQSWVLPPPW